jgi:hypothetical protein
VLNELSQNQLLLAEVMSDISERAYYAGWMDGLEHALWAAVTGGNRHYGHHVLSDSELSELLELSRICDGWIRFDEKHEEVFVSLSDWREKYFNPSLAGA